MAEYLTKNLKMAISTTPEATYNQIKTGNADTYLGMLTTGRAFYVPDKDKLDDTGKIGTGREFPTEQRSSYVTIPSLEITEEVNIDIGAILLRRAMGGTDVVSAVTAPGATIKDHTFGLDLSATNRQLPSSSVLWALGGADYIWGGVVIESFAISQTNSDVPQMTVGLVGSGLHKRLRYLTANGNLAVNGSNPYTGPYAGGAGTEYPPTFPMPTTQRYMIGAESELIFSPQTTYTFTVTSANATAGALYANNGQTFTVTTTISGATTLVTTGPGLPSASGTLTKVSGTGDPTITFSTYVLSATPYSLTANGQRLKAFSATLTNNHRTDDRRPGDPRVNSLQPRAGHYVNRMNHGDRTVAAEMTVMLDDQLNEFVEAYNDTIIESFTYKAKGAFLLDNSGTAETDKQAEFELTFPKCYFRAVRGSDDSGDAVLTISIFPVDNGTTGPMVARIRNNSAASIV